MIKSKNKEIKLKIKKKKNHKTLKKTLNLIKISKNKTNQTYFI